MQQQSSTIIDDQNQVDQNNNNNIISSSSSSTDTPTPSPTTTTNSSYFNELVPKESFELSTRPYLKQITQQFTGSIIEIDNDPCILFYQAYNSQIANWVVQHQTFENCPNFDKKRMSWIKPNYLWMMYRSEYATARNQTNILALYIKKESFENELLKHAVCSMYYPELAGYYKSQKEWTVHCSQMKQQVAQLMNKNEVEKVMEENACFARVQWDPYHTPSFGNINGGLTRAIQIGVKGSFLRSMCNNGACKKIEDITQYVHEQHDQYKNSKDITIPIERYIPIENEEIRKRLAIVDLIKSPSSPYTNLNVIVDDVTNVDNDDIDE